MNQSTPTSRRYDIIIAGGSLAGAASAILLLREKPQLKILIVEKSPAFTRRVGEATVEISSYFLGRVLGLTQYLNDAHLLKQGMRFWFYNERTQTLADCAEIGGKYLSRVGSYQLDRSKLDEEVLRRAKAMGAEILRPATIGKITLVSGGEQTVEVRHGEQTEMISARWVIDASGVAALLARQQGWFKPNTDHPTSAVWARWTGVKDWDGLELAQKFPDWAMACFGTRSTATNHFSGDGWWAWCIPLRGGDVSIGLVFDQRLTSFPEGGSLGERMKTFLSRHPVAKEIMTDAAPREGDVFWRKNLPYVTTTFAGDGFVIVGDAAGFIDPFYSPGIDWISYTTYCSTQLILAQQRGEDTSTKIAQHNIDFSQSYDRWFKAIYQDKYEYLGEYDLMRIAFLLDVGLYYFGVARQPFMNGHKALMLPTFSGWRAKPAFKLIQFYNNRLAKIGRARRVRNARGRTNDNRRYLFPGYIFAPRSLLLLAGGFLSWFKLELTEGWRTWFRSTPKPLPVETPMTKMASASSEM